MNIIFTGKCKTEKDMLKLFKEEFELEYRIKLDFRSLHKFLPNNYGAYPHLDYNLAKKIVSFTFNFVNSYIEEYKDKNSEGYFGYTYNLDMSVEELRTQTAKDFIFNKISETFKNTI